ncbi:MAG: hypothetical protein IJA35_07155 [Clostridia bacterium]|nr:hypothetical protein [Clostridia bacterium]
MRRTFKMQRLIGFICLIAIMMLCFCTLGCTVDEPVKTPSSEPRLTPEATMQPNDETQVANPIYAFYRDFYAIYNDMLYEYGIARANYEGDDGDITEAVTALEKLMYDASLARLSVGMLVYDSGFYTGSTMGAVDGSGECVSNEDGSFEFTFTYYTPDEDYGEQELSSSPQHDESGMEEATPKPANNVLSGSLTEDRLYFTFMQNEDEEGLAYISQLDLGVYSVYHHRGSEWCMMILSEDSFALLSGILDGSQNMAFEELRAYANMEFRLENRSLSFGYINNED